MGGRHGRNGGVELREKSIRIVFSYRGKQRKETLYLDNAPLPNTPANAKYALRVAAQVRESIKAGTFVYKEFFPNSPNAEEHSPDDIMLHATMDRWLDLLELKPSTKAQYVRRINSFWKKALPDQAIRAVRHSHILEALKKGTWKSGKSRNNELSMIRGFFEFAKHDKLIDDNPCEDVSRVGYQPPPPDPFSLSEANLILKVIAEKEHEQTRNYCETMFFTGMRSSEGIAAAWSNFDQSRRELKIDGGNVYDEETDTTKTFTARIIKLNSVAFRAIMRQKNYTFFSKSGKIFHDPATGHPWSYAKITDVRTFWERALKLAGVRYRKPYNMRHTYATIGLMGGAKPAFMAKQLGHSLQMFFNVYSKWISSDDDMREMDRIEAAINANSPELTQKLG